jgi:outer membrane protein assembly factor BamB
MHINVKLWVIAMSASLCAAQPVITNLSAPSLDRSERIVVTGAGFGVAPGELIVDDIESWVTDWSSTRIVGYVPEAASLGDVDVVVSAGGNESAPAALEVTPRTPDGLVRWRFGVDSPYMLHRPGIATDATIYLSDLYGRLYALSPDGGLLWIADSLQGQIGSGTEGPVVVGADGTIYVGVNPLGPNVDLVALNPDATIKWSYTDPTATSIAAGPGIGPDGNVYIAFYAIGGGSQGAMSFTPAGSVRWSNTGNPSLYEHGALGAEIVFAPLELNAEPGQMVVTVDNYSDRRVYAFDMQTGTQRFAVEAGGGEAVGLQPQLQPAIGIDGRIIMAEFLANGPGWGLQTFMPEDGERDWRFDPGVFSGIAPPFVGVDGSIYMSWDGARVTRLTKDGREIWEHEQFDLYYDAVPSPLNDIVLCVGRQGHAEPGWFRALDVETGEIVFQVDLPEENGGTIGPSAPPLFTPDGTTALVPCSIPAGDEDNQYSYIYAVQTAGCPADVNADGELNILDFVAFQNAFTSGDPAADCDGNGAFNILDFVCFQGLFQAGCP